MSDWMAADREGQIAMAELRVAVIPARATVDQAVGKLRLLMKIPASGDGLPHSRRGRRAKERFDFGGCGGMRAYFCIKHGNSKGEEGPWVPMFPAVIPQERGPAPGAAKRPIREVREVQGRSP